MPWSNDNYPDAMKNLDPKIREKAILIAEAIRKSGAKDGIAIATGIKKAKGLVKLAAGIPKVVVSHGAEQFFNELEHTMPIGKRIAIAISKAKNAGVPKQTPSLKERVKAFQSLEHARLF